MNDLIYILSTAFIVEFSLLTSDSVSDTTQRVQQALNYETHQLFLQRYGYKSIATMTFLIVEGYFHTTAIQSVGHKKELLLFPSLIFACCERVRNKAP